MLVSESGINFIVDERHRLDVSVQMDKSCLPDR